MPSSSNLPSSEAAKVSNTLDSGLPEMMETISQRIHTMEHQQVARYDKHDKELKEVKGLLITLIHHLTGGKDLHPLAQRVVDEVDSAVVEAVVDGEPLTAPAPAPDQAKATETPASSASSLEYDDVPCHVPVSEMPMELENDDGPSEAEAPQVYPLSAIYALGIRRETSWDKPVRTEEDRLFTSSRDLSPLFKKTTPPSAPPPPAPPPPAPSPPVLRRVGIRREVPWNKPFLTAEDEIFTSSSDLNPLFPTSTPLPAPSMELASFATPSRSGPSSAATSGSGAQLPSPAYTPSPLVQTTTLPPSSPTEYRPQAPSSATKRGGEKRRHLEESSTEEGPSKRRKSARIGQDNSPSLSGPKTSALKTKAKLRRNATQFL